MTTMHTLNRDFAAQAASGDFVARGIAKAIVAQRRTGGDGFAAEFARLRPHSKAIMPALDTSSALGLTSQPSPEFAELVRHGALLGRIPGARIVPANTRLTAVSSGVTAGFITEGQPIPVGSLAFGAATVLRPATIATILPFSTELARAADPAAFGVIERDTTRALAAAQDAALLDGAAAVNQGRPASLLYNVNALGGGSPLSVEDDVEALVKAVRGGEAASPVFLTSLSGALYLATARDANGERLFPDVTLLGGTLLGAPVLISPAAAAKLIFLDGATVWYADLGVELDTATAASFQFSDAPTAGAQHVVSLWQTNTIALRALQHVTWRLADDTGIAYCELPLGSPVV